MIAVQDIFWSLAESAKSYISGQDPIPEFNSKLNEAQRAVFDLLSPEYDKNERVRSLLEPFTRVESVTSAASGVINKPDNFHRVLGGIFVEDDKSYLLRYAKENEMINSDYIPSRKASIENGVVYFTYVNDIISLTPKEELTIDLSYLVYPSQAKLVYEYEVAKQSYVQLDEENTVNLEWNTNAYNLILNFLLLKYSILTREELKTEIANMGIMTDKINMPV